MKYLLTGQETERLKFRLLRHDDFDAWLPLFKAKNVGKFLGMKPGLSEMEQCEAYFKKSFHRYENNLGGMNVLISKESNQLVGMCGLVIQTIENEERLEIGYAILPEFWRQGYAIEAARKCKDYAFENTFVDNLISSIDEENISSEKVALNNGMTFEKKVDKLNIFSISKKDWKQAN